MCIEPPGSLNAGIGVRGVAGTTNEAGIKHDDETGGSLAIYH